MKILKNFLHGIYGINFYFFNGDAVYFSKNMEGRAKQRKLGLIVLFGRRGMMKDKTKVRVKAFVEQQKLEVEQFYKDAFCVDGKVIVLSPKDIEETGLKIAGVVQLDDSKKGRFYIAVLESTK